MRPSHTSLLKLSIIARWRGSCLCIMERGDGFLWNTALAEGETGGPLALRPRRKRIYFAGQARETARSC